MYQVGSQAIALGTLLKNLVFLNGAFALDIVGYNGVTWSLFFEFVFYLVFPLLFLLATRAGNPRRMAPLLLWLLVILAAWALSYGEWFLFLPFLAGAWAGLQPRARLEQVARRCPDIWLVGAYLTTTTVACLLVPLPRRIVGGGLLWSPPMPVFILCQRGGNPHHRQGELRARVPAPVPYREPAAGTGPHIVLVFSVAHDRAGSRCR